MKRAKHASRLRSARGGAIRPKGAAKVAAEIADVFTERAAS